MQKPFRGGKGQNQLAPYKRAMQSLNRPLSGELILHFNELPLKKNEVLNESILSFVSKLYERIPAVGDLPPSSTPLNHRLIQAKTKNLHQSQQPLRGLQGYLVLSHSSPHTVGRRVPKESSERLETFDAVKCGACYNVT